jgi:hypothetical protein
MDCQVSTPNNIEGVVEYLYSKLSKEPALENRKGIIHSLSKIGIYHGGNIQNKVIEYLGKISDEDSYPDKVRSCAQKAIIKFALPDWKQTILDFFIFVRRCIQVFQDIQAISDDVEKTPQPEIVMKKDKNISLLRIVVASPSDVQAERDRLQVIIEELNRGVANQHKLRLELIRWEIDASPGFNPSGAQGRIDPVLNIEDCDILIGIFWTRFGTPTMGSKSGAEHEFLTAYKAWKEKGTPHIMVYFNQKPCLPKTTKDAEQMKQLLEFKETFPAEGLWWKYEGEEVFESEVRQHLTNFIIHEYHPNT